MFKVVKHNNLVTDYVDKDFYGNNIKDGDYLSTPEVEEQIELMASKLYDNEKEQELYIKEQKDDMNISEKVNMGDYDLVKE